MSTILYGNLRAEIVSDVGTRVQRSGVTVGRDMGSGRA